MIFLKKENLNKIKESLNLNLIAVENEYQSRIGKFFLQKIISHYREIGKPKYMTVKHMTKEQKFYLDKCGFKIIGKNKSP